VENPATRAMQLWRSTAGFIHHVIFSLPFSASPALSDQSLQ